MTSAPTRPTASADDMARLSLWMPAALRDALRQAAEAADEPFQDFILARLWSSLGAPKLDDLAPCETTEPA